MQNNSLISATNWIMNRRYDTNAHADKQLVISECEPEYK